MIFVIGGSYQGKWEFVKARFGLSDADLFVCDSENVNLNARAIAHIERFADILRQFSVCVPSKYLYLFPV